MNFERPKILSSEEIAKIEKQRMISDAELLKGGAEYKIEKEKNILDITDEQMALANKEMLDKFTADEGNKEKVISSEEQIEKERKEAMARLAGHSFKTEKGSVYTYDAEGRTVRYKAATKEKYEPQDVTVFVDLNGIESQVILDSIFGENSDRKKVYIVERQGNNQPKIIRKFSDISNPDRLYLVMVDKDGKMIAGIDKDGKPVSSSPKKVSLRPMKGYSVFDTRHFKKGDEEFTERHLGHKVTEIN